MSHFPSKAILASFHQGDDKFGATKGVQCSCISLFGVVFSSFKNIGFWDINNLEYVIEQGDELYKTTGSNTFLSCPELPQTFFVESVQVTVDLTQHDFGFLHHGSNCN